MVIDDFHINGVAVTPFEANPPLLIDTDAVLAFSITFQNLELIRDGNREVLQVFRGIQLLKLHQCPLLHVARQPPGVFTTPYSLGFLTAKGLDHGLIVTRHVTNVKRLRFQDSARRQICIGKRACSSLSVQRGLLQSIKTGPRARQLLQHRRLLRLAVPVRIRARGLDHPVDPGDEEARILR